MKRFLSHCLPILFSTFVAMGPARAYENLQTRALVALPLDDGQVFLSWRFLSRDGANCTFNVYRSQQSGSGYVKVNATPLAQATNFVDTQTEVGETYYYIVRPLKGGQQGAASNEAMVTGAAQGRKSIRLDIGAPYLEGNVTGCPQEMWLKQAVADLNGDGLFDFVIAWGHRKEIGWDSAGQDAGTCTGDECLILEPPYDTYHLQAYLHDGTFLWHYTTNILPKKRFAFPIPFLAYDFDGDGRAEVVTKTNYGDFDSPSFHIAVLDGMTGVTLTAAPWPVAEARPFSMMTVAYLNVSAGDILPSLIVGEGTYLPNNKLRAYRLVGGALAQQWEIEGIRTAHTLQALDFDGDENDELIIGSSLIDEHGDLLWQFTNSHGDMSNVGDFDVARPGYEMIFGIEDYAERDNVKPDGIVMVGLAADPQNISILQRVKCADPTGRAANIDPDAPGYELAWIDQRGWDADDEDYDPNAPHKGLVSFYDGQTVYRDSEPLLGWFYVEWDGDDAAQEIIFEPEKPTVALHRYTGGGQTAVVTNLYGAGGTESMRNYVVADILGDYREEIITRGRNSPSIMIYTNTTPLDRRKVTPLEDRYYRSRVTQWAVGYQYNQNGWIAGIDIPQPTGQLTLSGQIYAQTDESTEGLGGVVLELSGDAARSTLSGQNGAFMFVGLAEGSYTLKPQRAGYCFYPTTRTVTDMSLDISGLDFEGIWTLPVTAQIETASQKPYTFAPLASGERLYLDRDYVIDTVPATLAEQYVLLRTAMEDKSAAQSPLVSLQATQSATVVVALSQALDPPAWMQGWTLLADPLTADFGPEFGLITYDLYQKTFSAGPIDLGPLQTQTHMYAVMIRQVADCGCRDGDGDGYGLNCETEPDCDDSDGAVHPGAAEACNGLDDDCDGAVDEDFELQSDPQHCGACGNVCAPAQATGRCVAGVCTIAACDPGYVDANQDPQDGCEQSTTEICGNGVDDNNDGRIDEGCDPAGTDDGGCGCRSIGSAGKHSIVYLYLILALFGAFVLIGRRRSGRAL
jgi:rhamnogalacturonan endolyase